MRLISWNVNGRVGIIQDQINAIGKRKPDLIALQEVTQKTSPIFHEGLHRQGFEYVVDSFERIKEKNELIGPRRYGVLIASRFPLSRIAQIKVPWEECALSVEVENPLGRIQVHAIRILPGCTNGNIKIETLNAIHNHLRRKSATPRILCGDFNTPQEEKEDGRIIPWGTEEWAVGELNILEGLTKFGIMEVYRYRNGFSNTQEFSWYARPHIGRRYDHIYASSSLLKKAKCEYIHWLREKKLSDHSAIMADFSMQ